MAVPLPYDPEIGDQILERLANGESLRKICRDSEDMPALSTLFKWLANNKDFADQYARAREAQADALFDETLDIADETKEDYIKRLNHNGGEAGWEVNGEAIARSKLRIDTRKWMAGKLRPKKYGEKLEVDQTVGVTGEMASLLGRIAERGNRMVSGMNLLESARALPAGKNNIASEAENDGSDQS